MSLNKKKSMKNLRIYDPPTASSAWWGEEEWRSKTKPEAVILVLGRHVMKRSWTPVLAEDLHRNLAILRSQIGLPQILKDDIRIRTHQDQRSSVASVGGWVESGTNNEIKTTETWTCSTCGFLNFVNRRSCKAQDCETLRPDIYREEVAKRINANRIISNSLEHIGYR